MDARDETPKPPPAPRLSATILLARDGSAGLEVFMVERHHQVDFVAGALVFPGGKVEPADAAEGLASRCAGIEGLHAEGRGVLVAAIRETFEECGVLLARPQNSPELVGAARLRELEDRYREALHQGRASLLDLVTAEDLVLAADLLVPFAHWITPEFMPRRFDTHFFLVAAPGDQVALHDGSESVDSVWINPAEAVADAEAGRRTIIFPTLLNLKKLGRSSRVGDAIEEAQHTTVVTVLPRLEKRPDGVVMRLPEDAGYGVTEVPQSALGPLPGQAPSRS